MRTNEFDIGPNLARLLFAGIVALFLYNVGTCISRDDLSRQKLTQEFFEEKQ